jgi:hypothetical protein
MAFYQLLNSTKLALGKAEILRKLDPRLQPELRFPLRRLDMDVNPWLFAREEEPTIRALAEDGWAHLERAPNDPVSAAASRRRAVRCKPMFGPDDPVRAVATAKV